MAVAHDRCGDACRDRDPQDLSLDMTGSETAESPESRDLGNFQENGPGASTMS
jgi:hypothetical protein